MAASGPGTVERERERDENNLIPALRELPTRLRKGDGHGPQDAVVVSTDPG